MIFISSIFLLLLPCVSSLRLTIESHSNSDGRTSNLRLTNDAPTNVAEWKWNGIPTEDGSERYNANGIIFIPSAMTASPVSVARSNLTLLPLDLQLEVANSSNNFTANDRVTILSYDTITITPTVWSLESFIHRPLMEFLSSAMRCESTFASALVISFICEGRQPITTASLGGPYTWTANISSTLIGGGLDEDAESALSRVTIDITTSTGVTPLPSDSFIMHLLSIGFSKSHTNIRLNSDMLYMHSRDSARRSRARIAVGFMWVFILLTVTCGLVVTALWIPWTITCFGNRLMNRRTIFAIVVVMGGIFSAVGVTEGLAGFLILVILALLTTAVISTTYCCVRARHTSRRVHPTPVETLASGHGGTIASVYSAGDEGATVNPVESEFGASINAVTSTPLIVQPPLTDLDWKHAEEEAFLNNGESGPKVATIVVPFSRYPDALGTVQRRYAGWGAMMFLVGTVICVAIFGLWNCDDYLVWDRHAARPIVEFMPQVMAKATYLVYAFDGFANRIKMNNIFFDVSTQWCGTHYSMHLTTAAQQYTSIYKSFILKYSIDMSHYEPSDYRAYSSVNHWFIRNLAPGVRPIAAIGDHSIVLNPCDARVMVFDHIPIDSRVWIKDSSYSVEGLIGELAFRNNPRFHDASMALIRLAPQDYHQFHSPVDGVVKRIYQIEGTVHSVNADGMRSANWAIYNQRTIVIIDTSGYADIGEVAYVAIGALCVGSITVTASLNSFVSKGSSLGYFQFGGSTVALLFEDNRIEFDPDIIQHSRQKVETLVQMGTRLAKMKQ